VSELEADLQNPPRSYKEKLGSLLDLLERSKIDPDDIGQVTRINLYQGFYKDEDGNAQTVDMHGIVLSPQWESGPEWPVVQPAAPTVIRPVKRNATAKTTKTTVILPDPQIGFRRLDSGDLIPMHDEDAMLVALQILRDAKADAIVNLGDFIDLPEWSSKFLVLPEFVLTTQPALDRAHRFLAEQRAVAPEATMSLLAGNHDDRMGKAIAKNAMAALRLRRANSPHELPVLSMSYLLRLEDLGVEYVPGYPAGRIQVARGGAGQTPLYAIHGEKLDIAKVAKDERQSFIQGHIHRLAHHAMTYERAGRPETVVALSPGCLCRIDGAVPSTRSSVDDLGVPLVRYETWQQGMAIVEEGEDGFYGIETIQIIEGTAVWRGRRYSARQDSVG
jgi:hypothetical protein